MPLTDLKMQRFIVCRSYVIVLRLHTAIYIQMCSATVDVVVVSVWPQHTKINAPSIRFQCEYFILALNASEYGRNDTSFNVNDSKIDNDKYEKISVLVRRISIDLYDSTE